MAVASRPPFRAFLVGTPHWQHLEVFLVRGLDRCAVPLYHAFGPPHEAVPPGWRLVLASLDPDRPQVGRVHVEFETYRDPAGVSRFKPVYRLPHTNN